MAAVDFPNGDAGDLLAQPTRRRLFALLGEIGGMAFTDDLAARLALHPNGVRTHLWRMRDAGLLLHHRVPGPRGRPRDGWSISPGAEPGGEPPRAYRALAGWLARAIPGTPRRLAEIESAGREIGRDLAPSAATPQEAVVNLMAALGFQPDVDHPDPDRIVCVLSNCPYRDSVRENQAVICGLHRGLVRGVLDRVAPDATLQRFVPHDPETAGCEIEISGLVAAP